MGDSRQDQLDCPAQIIDPKMRSFPLPLHEDNNENYFYHLFLTLNTQHFFDNLYSSDKFLWFVDLTFTWSFSPGLLPACQISLSICVAQNWNQSFTDNLPLLTLSASVFYFFPWSHSGFLFVLSFNSAGDLTQDLGNTRHRIYHWAICPVLYFSALKHSLTSPTEAKLSPSLKSKSNVSFAMLSFSELISLRGSMGQLFPRCVRPGFLTKLWILESS